jgi:hypothetical protein
VTLHREPMLRYHVEDRNDPMNELVCNDDEFRIVCNDDEFRNFAILANSLALEEESVQSEVMVFGRCSLMELNPERLLELGLYLCREV